MGRKMKEQGSMHVTITGGIPREVFVASTLCGLSCGHSSRYSGHVLPAGSSPEKDSRSSGRLQGNVDLRDSEDVGPANF